MVRESSKLKEGGKTTVLGIQHVFAMFGSTILVPILTGLPVSVALFCAGIGTLIFHLVTKGKVPVFLGSSFAFIAAIQVVSATEGIEFATGGIVAAGCVYLLLAVLVFFRLKISFMHSGARSYTLPYIGLFSNASITATSEVE